MTKAHKTVVSLKVMGDDLDPEKVTCCLGVSPKRTWRKGDLKHSKSSIRYVENGWYFESPLAPDAPLMDKVNDLVNRFGPVAKKFALLPPGVTVLLSCVVYIYEESPDAYFDKSVIAFLASINADLDFDVYTVR